jgi:chemotaxis methyl-accepting protein methylase
MNRTEQLWQRLPGSVRKSRPMTRYGSWLHARVRRHAEREMYLGTYFLRNRPALELMRRLAQDADAPLRVAVLGCSIGVEVYSIVWTLRGSRPDLKLDLYAADIAPEAVRVGAAGRYGAEASEFVRCPIFHGLSDAEWTSMFDWEGDVAAVRPWLREGITWEVADASDPELSARLGPQDLVVANNFLCHLRPAAAEACLRNLAQLVAPGGYLFVSGVDLEVRSRVARTLAWEPIAELRAEIHDGDSAVRSDWPWRWWGLEPLDRRRPDWELRYSAAFRVRP